MDSVANNKSLEKLAHTFGRLDLEKRIAAAKWLEGVIVSQILTSEERESIVNASNEYTESLTDDDYKSKVDDLIEYLRKLQESHASLPNITCGEG